MRSVKVGYYNPGTAFERNHAGMWAAKALRSPFEGAYISAIPAGYHSLQLV